MPSSASVSRLVAFSETRGEGTCHAGSLGSVAVVMTSPHGCGRGRPGSSISRFSDRLRSRCDGGRRSVRPWHVEALFPLAPARARLRVLSVNATSAEKEAGKAVLW